MSGEWPSVGPPGSEPDPGMQTGASARQAVHLPSAGRPRWRGRRVLRCSYIMPSVFGSQIDIVGQYVTITRKTSIVTSHGHTAIVSSVIPIFVIPEAT